MLHANYQRPPEHVWYRFIKIKHDSKIVATIDGLVFLHPCTQITNWARKELDVGFSIDPCDWIVIIVLLPPDGGVLLFPVGV